MEALGIKVPLVEFGEVSDLRGLINVLYEHVQAANSGQSVGSGV